MKETEIKLMKNLADKYGYELIDKTIYLLASFEVGTRTSDGEESERCIITQEEKELIKKSKLSLRIDVPQGYYTCGSDDRYDLTQEDIEITEINGTKKDYLEEDELIQQNGIIRKFINLSIPNSKESIKKKLREDLELLYIDKQKLAKQISTLEDMDKDIQKSINIKQMKINLENIKNNIVITKQKIGALK